MGEGHRVIHGVAGSGKTMILGYRAQVLAQAERLLADVKAWLKETKPELAQEP